MQTSCRVYEGGEEEPAQQQQQQDSVLAAMDPEQVLQVEVAEEQVPSVAEEGEEEEEQVPEEEEDDGSVAKDRPRRERRRPSNRYKNVVGHFLFLCDAELYTVPYVSTFTLRYFVTLYRSSYIPENNLLVGANCEHCMNGKLTSGFIFLSFPGGWMRRTATMRKSSPPQSAGSRPSGAWFLADRHLLLRRRRPPHLRRRGPASG